jgi:hypothetical protein
MSRQRRILQVAEKQKILECDGHYRMAIYRDFLWNLDRRGNLETAFLTVGADRARGELRVRFIFDLFFLFCVGGRFFKVFYPFAQPGSDFRQFPGPENDQDYDKNYDKFWHTYSKHLRLLFFRLGLFKRLGRI